MRSLSSLFFSSILIVQIAQSGEFYVSPAGSDSASGTASAPFKTLKRAKQAVRTSRAVMPDEPVSVVLKNGWYELDTPLIFNQDDSGSASAPVVWKAENPNCAIITGGKRIRNWTNVDGDHWVASIPAVKEGKWYFRQLFAGEKRLPRARIPNDGFFHTAGGLRQPWTKGSNGWEYRNNTNAAPELIRDAYLSRCGFSFKNGDIQEWENWQEAEILTYHSWEASWQTIRKMDLQKNQLYMNSPCRYPIGHFGGRMRYRVENIPAAMDRAGEWYLDGRDGTLHYMAGKGEDPNEMDIVAPYVSRLLIIQGEEAADRKVQNLKFENLRFEHSRYEMGQYDIAPDWPKEIRDVYPEFPENPRPGFTGAQAAPLCGESIIFRDAVDITVEGCRFRHCGSYAVKIGVGCRHVNIIGCEVYDLGGGGILIGYLDKRKELADPVKIGMPESRMPMSNRVANCWIHQSGQVHPAAVGIWMAQTSHNVIEHNEIEDLSYSGVSSGWSWGSDDNYTHDNLVANNYIHHVSRALGDSAGLYSLGRNEGSRYFENFLDEIVKGRGVHGVVDAMGFDDGSYGFTVERNVVGRISRQPVSFNRRHGNGWHAHKWIDNSFRAGNDKSTPVVKHKAELDTPEMTLAAEIYVSSFPKGKVNRRWIIGKNRHELTDTHYGLIIIDDRAGAYLNIGGGRSGQVLLRSEDLLQNATVNNLAMSYDGETLKLYLNGKLSGEKTVGKTRRTGRGNLSIGKRPDGYGAQSGLVRMAHVWNRALSSDEITAMMLDASAPPPATGLVYSWELKLEESDDIDFTSIRRNSGLRDKWLDRTAEWVKAEQKRTGNDPRAWVRKAVDGKGRNDKPHVLLVGDSITDQYYLNVKNALKAIAYTSKLTTSSAIDEAVFMRQLKESLSNGKLDVIHFNNTLHASCSPMLYRRCYEQALRMIVDMQPDAKIIVALSTPLKPGTPQESGNPLMQKYNDAARVLARKYGAKVNDLFSLMKGKAELYKDPYHFIPKGRSLQAGVVVGLIKEELTASPANP